MKRGICWCAIVSMLIIVVSCGAHDSSGDDTLSHSYQDEGGEVTDVATQHLSPEMKELVEDIQLDIQFLSPLSPQALGQLDVKEDEVLLVDDFASPAEQEQTRLSWVADCLHEAGFPAEIEGRTIRMRDKNIQEMTHASEADDICIVEGVIRYPLPPIPVDREGLEDLYRLQVETLECLEREGFDVGDPPTFDTFFEDGGVWAAYDSFPAEGYSQERWLEINRICPQP